MSDVVSTARATVNRSSSSGRQGQPRAAAGLFEVA
jgi:hypothetical protein